MWKYYFMLLNSFKHMNMFVWGPFKKQECMSLYMHHLALMAFVRDQFTPKHHIVVHLIKGCRFLGSPSLYATWVDEALNKQLKQACKNVSAHRFHASVLMRMRDVLKELRGSKRARGPG